MMYYYVDGEGFTSPEEVAEYIAENIDSDYFDDFLNECYNSVEIFGMTYEPSYVLYKVDPVAYDVTMNDWRSGIYDDVLYDIEHYHFRDIYGFEIDYEEIPDDDDANVETLAQFLGRKLLSRK